jgi:hypothetical protein
VPTTASDKQVLAVCAGAVVIGVTLLGLGCWLMPLRTLRHAWRNR